MTTIRDLVGARAQPTVVRLEESLDAPWITESYCVTPDVRRHVDALRHALSRDAGTGAFLIGPYGSGKSHFLAWLVQAVRAGRLGEPLTVVALSLLHYPAEARLEDVVCGAAGIPVGTGDRRPAWAAALQRSTSGLLLVIDELSEFLRSKPDAHRFNEDVRFLQYLGELAGDGRLFVVCAMQEAIEHTGELEHATYRKIQDRYPLRMRLTPSHVRTLVSESLLVKRPGYDDAVAERVRQLRAAVPDATVDFGALASIYPIHPATLDLLEEVRDRFSQARGVVGFVTTQLLGDPGRGIAPFLDEPWGALLTPDAIVAHFEDILEVQAEFQPLAQQLFPWYRRHMGELFETERLAELAHRLLRLLALVHLSPQRERLTAGEAASWLLFAASRTDPSRNQAIIERTLDTLATRGRYIRKEAGGYRVDVEDDGASRLDRALERELAELPDAAICFELIAGLDTTGFPLFALPRDVWQSRRTAWCLHERLWSLWVGNEDPPRPPQSPALVVRLPWGQAPSAHGCTTLHPAPLQLTPPLRELAALARLRERPLAPELVELAGRRISERLPLFQHELRASLADARAVRPTGTIDKALPLGPRDGLDDWLGRWALGMLQRDFPQFERLAPAEGPLPKEAWRELVRWGLEHDLGDPDAPQLVRSIREGYLVPMKLLERAGRGYVVRRTDTHDLVKLVLPLLDGTPSPKTVYTHLAGPVYGLVPDQIHALLLTLLLLGEVDIEKGGRSLRELHDSLPLPIQYDRITAGRALPPAALTALTSLADGLHLKPPAQWTIEGQRQVIGRLTDVIRARAERLRPLLPRLEGALSEQAREVLAWSDALSGEERLAAFEALLVRAGSAPRILERLGFMADLPERFERQVTEVGRMRHLLSQPGLADEGVEEPPPLDRPDAVDAWISRARSVVAAYAARYREAHDAWWAARADHPAWTWHPPAVAWSKHAGVDADAWRRAREALRRCAGLGPLDFQSRCACGFDGERAPAGDGLDALAAIRDRVERELRAVFSQAEVRARVRTWAEIEPAAMAYVEGQADWPTVEDLRGFDEHLGGVDVVRAVGAGALLEGLLDRTWEPAALSSALAERVQAVGARRVRLEAPEAAGLLPWCVEQCLRHGEPLPAGVDVTGVPIPAAWVSPAALERLESLGLGAAATAVLRLLVDGALPAPDRPSPLVAAALATREPTLPLPPAALATLAERLYRHHEAIWAAARDRWLQRLDALATTPLSEPCLPVEAVVRAHPDHSWLVVDALGLPLLGPLVESLRTLLPGYALDRTLFAEAPRATTTDAFYRRLAEAGVNHPFEKVDALDGLLHGRSLPLDDLWRIAAAELGAALSSVRPRLGPLLLVTADHGFRLAPTGRGYTHGGPSTLERTVPVLLLRRAG